MPGVRLDGVSKAYGPAKETWALREVTLEVREGELLVLVGPSGSGKTTLLRLIAGLEDASTGAISIGEQVVNSVAPQDRGVAMVFQEHSLYPHMTVAQNLAFGLKLRGVPKPEIENRVRQVESWLDLQGLAERLPNAISGGERQRVALGRALALRPKVFLLDEPLSNLDAPLRARMRRLISKLHRETGITAIYVTHDQAEAMALGQRLAVIRDGVVQQVAEPLRVYRCPANLFVAGFIGTPAMNLLRGRLQAREESAWFRFGPGSGPEVRLRRGRVAQLKGALDKDVVLGTRPEHVILEPAAAAGGAEGTLPAVVEAVELFGAETHLYLATKAGEFVARAPSGNSVRPGDTVRIGLDFEKEHFFDADSGVRLELGRLPNAPPNV